MRALLERCPPERVLFGTDGGLVPEVRQRYVALRVRQLEHLELDPGRRRAMLADNPQRLLARA
jgi:predicted TIM-barrel fold metal-dependent hydrolase